MDASSATWRATVRSWPCPCAPRATLRLGPPRPLFALQGKYGWASYDIAPDGRFLAIVPEALTSEQPLTVVVNWTSERSATPTPR